MSRVRVNAVEPFSGTTLTLGDTGDEVKVGGTFTAGASILHIQHQESSGTSGGSSVAGAWTTRTLNTEVTNEITGASLATDQITLPAGTYEIQADGVVAGGANGNNSILRFRNTTDSDTVAIGIAGEVGTGSEHNVRPTLRGKFTIGATKVFALQYYGQGSLATTGLGQPITSGEVEVYADVYIRKVG